MPSIAKTQDYCFVVITGPEDGFCHDRFTCIMSMKEFNITKVCIDRITFYEFNIYSFPIAKNITPKQAKKLVDVRDSWSIWTILTWFEWDKPEIWQKTPEQREVMEDFITELEKSKWDPRSVLGRLEFDRRAVADGIVYSDE